jgi:polyhydroxyalkanoate synthesis regulator phasin
MTMGFTERLKKEALGLSAMAMERLFADEKRATTIANVIGKVQQGKAVFDKGQVTVMHQLNFASRSDFKEISKQLSSLRRRVRDLDEKLKSV